MKTVTEKFEFTGNDGQLLKGNLERPKDTPARIVGIFAHCFTCDRRSLAASRISKHLAEAGIAMLRFDFTGLGESHGEFSDTGFCTNIADLVSAANALHENIGMPSLLIGHSLGGAAVIAAAHEIESVKNVVTIGAPFEVEHVLGQLGAAVEEIKSSGMAAVTIAGRPFNVGETFVEQTQNQDQRLRLEQLTAKLLVIHAQNDDIVSFTEGEKIFAAARNAKTFVTLESANHLLTHSEDARNTSEEILHWLKLGLPQFQIDANRPIPATVHVRTKSGKFTQIVRSESHDWLADEPESVGGDDLGPTPYDHLLAALGTCTSMTIALYAERKEIPLEGVEIELEHGREHAADCVSCDASASAVDVIDRTIRLKGSFSEEAYQAMIAIADRCPVHRTLENRIEIKTTALR